MAIISFYLSFLFILRIALEKSSKKEDTFVIIAGILLFMLSGFRSIYFSSDTIGYVNRYILLNNFGFEYFWGNFIGNIGKDPFFYLVAKLISLTGANYRVWLMLMSGFFIFSVSRFVIKYSSDGLMSFYSFISLGFLYFSFTGLRQAMALTIILFSIEYLKSRKVIPFISIVILSSLFHFSSFVFLLAYPVASMKLNWKQFNVIFISIAIPLLYRNEIINVLSKIQINRDLEYYIINTTTLNYSGLIIQMMIFLFCLCFIKNLLLEDKKNIIFYNLLVLGIVFQSFATVIAEFFRLSLYFNVISIILVPKAISSIKSYKLRVIVYMFVLTFFVLYVYWVGNFNGFELSW